MLWQSCLLWSSTWLPINPKCTLEGVQVVIKDPLKKQKTYDFPSKTWQITACVHVYDLSWKNRSQNQLVGLVGSPAVAAVKMNQCITIQIKGTQEMKSHLYMQQNAGVDCCFNRLKSSYFVIGAHSLCVFLSESHRWAKLSQCSVSPLNLNLSYDAWSWIRWEHKCSFPVRCQVVLLSRCLVKWNRPTSLPNAKTKIERVRQFCWVCFLSCFKLILLLVYLA